MALNPAGVPSRAGIQEAIDDAVAAAIGDSGWQPLSLSSPWVATAGAEYRVLLGVLWLRGTVQRPSGTNTTIGTLPPGARPIGSTWNTITRVDSAAMPIAIALNGNIVISGSYSNGALAHLSGVEFPVT